MNVVVILPAAGLGTRMGRPSPEQSGISRKQFMLLDGAPIFLHSVRKFARCARVTEIVIAVRAAEIKPVEELLHKEKLDKPVRVVEGGDSRQQSVENALAAIEPAERLIAVHDAVRPFIDLATIERVLDEAEESGAAIVGIVPVDTVKQVDRVQASRAKIRSTLLRERLVLAQTPQVFRDSLLRRAFQSARDDGFTGTDEASLVERLEAVEVSVVLGTDRNIKITKPTDMELARLYARQEAEQAGERQAEA
jgi:2-C-methyl-D-erythritol 4-phosphate cytidylyltransferase